MRISATFCREQEAIQRARAISEPLQSQRGIALAAASAWSKRAIAIDERIAAPGARDKLDTAIALEFAREEATRDDVDDADST
ncbi:hypothetical protein [Novosphingobium resinovorum]|uniref:hypothetical protein n=1 Tax=Novosphingobium resinovorum TaxID=158500 RepID=UPI002ED29E7F|nr:hypothetical protein [Novosphingobium resinovorum]